MKKSSSGPIAIALGLLVLTLSAAYFLRRDDSPRAPQSVAVPNAVPPPATSTATPPAHTVSSGPTRLAVAESPSGAGQSTVQETAAGRWQARGSVRAASGSAAVAGARVDVWLRRADGTAAPLGRATSGADGSYALELSRLEDMEHLQLAAARIEARVENSGFQPAQVSVPLESAVAKRVTLDARLAEGAAVRGRAVDSKGQAVPRATAAISLADGRSGPGGLTLVTEAEADEDGHFALGFATGGKLHLSVRADGIGTDAREIEVETRRDRDVGDVALVGGPPLAGVVLHLDGTPAQSMELWALEGQTSFQPDAFATVVRRAREVERDGGLSWSRAFTDSKGHFEFRGLRLDHYALKAADPAIVIEPRQGRWEPGQTNVQLEVQTPLLVVRVVDESGSPAPGAIVECTELGVEADGTYSPGGVRRVVARGPTASATFSADPETPLALRAVQRKHVAPEKIVFFGQGTQHLEETLVLAPRPTNGALRLSVNGVDPAKVSLRVALASATTGQRDEDLGVLDADPQGLVAGVPPGDHRILVDFGGEAGAWMFPWKSTAAVRVLPGAETAVAIEPVLGARLAIDCEIVGPPPPGLGDASKPAGQRERYGARFVLVPVGGGAERSLDLRLGTEDVYQLLPGEVAEARDLLPAGDWIVRVEGTRWMSTESRIRLVPGRRLAAVVEVRGR
ncbi:MAG: carboxypeptidase-like regulatory domain-containing protein [Planctomycetota bacterium]|nr:carboxypeptidase-like regulatory domain-containing protein [Planctomycetota bacterium]